MEAAAGEKAIGAARGEEIAVVLIVFGHEFRAPPKVSVKRGAGRHVQRRHPLLVAFAGDADEAFMGAHRRQLQPRQLRDAQAPAIQHLDDAGQPQAFGRFILHGGLQHRVQIVAGQNLGQRTGGAGRGQRLGGIVLAHPFRIEKTIELA